MGKSGLPPVDIDRWDSKFFDATIGKIRLSGKNVYPGFYEKLSALAESAKKDKISFLVIRLDDPVPAYEKDIESLGFKKYGESVDLIFEYPGKKEIKTMPACGVRLYKSTDTGSIRDIAKDAFRLSYLYKCGFSKRSDIDRYHSVWAENLSKENNTVVFVAEERDKIIGFAGLSTIEDNGERYGRIRLIAVHKKFRGRGIGRGLIQKCIGWAGPGIGLIRVRTQTDNKNALLAYKNAGFKEERWDAVFCKKIGKA